MDGSIKFAIIGWIRTFLIQSFSVIVLFLVSDYVYTNYIWIDDNQENIYRIKHDIYHHSLLPSFNGMGKWGETSYRVCTDGNGFINDCNNILSLKSNFDIAFIGDSFTEAIGMSYEDSFVGMFAAANPSINVANLSVTSYSPTIYRTKLQYFIEKGYSFKHVIAFIDISDVQDESLYFRDSNGHVYSINDEEIAQRTLFSISKTYIKDNFLLLTYVFREIKQLFIDEDDPLKRDRSEWTYNTSSSAYGDLGVTGSINKAILEMTQLYELLERNDIKLSIGVYPWPAQINEMAKYNSDANLQVDIWHKFCINRCANFINVFPDYFRLIKNSSVEDIYQSYFIKGDVHYNIEGNRLISDSLLKLDFSK